MKKYYINATKIVRFFKSRFIFKSILNKLLWFLYKSMFFMYKHFIADYQRRNSYLSKKHKDNTDSRLRRDQCYLCTIRPGEFIRTGFLILLRPVFGNLAEHRVGRFRNRAPRY